MDYFLQQLINGVTLGAIYGLIAIGYTMVYGIIGMINFAHGDIFMIGAFTALIAFLVMGLIGITWVPFALLLVLIIVVTATVSVYALQKSATLDMISLQRNADRTRAEALARSGVEIAERAMTVHELQIALDGPLGSALVADWRKRPAYRLLMRLPWRMDHRGVVRVNLEPFDRTPEEIHRTFLRMWRYYRS